MKAPITTITQLTKLTLLTLVLLAETSLAKFETWTNPEGQELTLKLVSKKKVASKLVGTFLTTRGKRLQISEDKLSKKSIEKLKTWAPKNSASVYSELFQDNLLLLKNGSLEKADDVKTPKKYYVFYYTASWCGPCQRFTPSLVKFYNKEKNDDFEIVLISSDRDKKAMDGYAKSKKMPWPHLELSKVPEFRKKYPSQSRGIPAMLVTDLTGKVLAKGNAYEVLPQLSKLVSD
jgi:thiol-disulfide isomerase/thioredoxin